MAKNNKNHEPIVQTCQTQPRDRPNENTYWVTEQLLAGEYPTDRSNDEQLTRQKLRQYLQCGITCFVDLTREGERLSYQSLLQQEAAKLSLKKPIRYRRFPIDDFGIPQDKNDMKQILNAIDECVLQQSNNDANNPKVYVHCRGGIGRTGTTVGCYLARHGYETNQALQEVNRLFQNSHRSCESSCSPETRAQEQFVLDWKKGE